MSNKMYVKYAWLLLASFAISSHALGYTEKKFKHPFYAGISGGVGWTTWGGLVPAANKANPAIIMSTPNYVNEDGAIWSVFAGYEFLPYFALEGAYMRYPDAKVVFDSMSLFTFENSGLTEFVTKTQVVSLVGKFMVFIPNTDIRVYSSLGAAETRRTDQIASHWAPSPTFGAGVNYTFTEYVMGEIGGSYTAGHGESELSPANDYFPFLYSVFLRLALRF